MLGRYAQNPPGATTARGACPAPQLAVVLAQPPAKVRRDAGVGPP